VSRAFWRKPWEARSRQAYPTVVTQGDAEIDDAGRDPSAAPTDHHVPCLQVAADNTLFEHLFYTVIGIFNCGTFVRN
jgi:hypothetical protein